LCLQDLLGPLAEPSPKQISDFAVPPLPEPPEELVRDFAALSQWRLRRVWTLLQSTPLERVDMLLYVTAGPGGAFGAGLASGTAAEQIESALELWEKAAAALQLRERTLADLVKVCPCKCRLEAVEASACCILATVVISRIVHDGKADGCLWNWSGTEDHGREIPEQLRVMREGCTLRASVREHSVCPCEGVPLSPQALQLWEQSHTAVFFASWISIFGSTSSIGVCCATQRWPLYVIPCCHFTQEDSVISTIALVGMQSI
jgi:hypothetical protein